MSTAVLLLGLVAVFVGIVLVVVSVGAAQTERPPCSAAKADSAANMPVFMALWLPLIRGRLTKPAEQPIKAPPLKLSLGMD